MSTCRNCGSGYAKRMRLTACLMCGNALKQADEALSLINLLNRDTGITSRPVT